MNNKKIQIFACFIFVIFACIIILILINKYDDQRKLRNISINNKFATFEIEQNKLKSKVTKIIHQSWKTNVIPKVFQRYYPSWKKCFPNYKHMFWTDNDNRAFIETHYKWFIPKYDSLPGPIYKADCSRYFYMFYYGGIYTDLDNECLRSFEHLLTNYSIVFGAIDNVPRTSPLNNKYVQNSFMYSSPNHPFWLELLLEIFHSNINDSPDIVTGPEILAKLIHRYISKYPFSNNIKIYDGKYFNPLTWGHTKYNPSFCKPFDGMKDEEYKKCSAYYKNNGSFVVQYHTHVWG